MAAAGQHTHHLSGNPYVPAAPTPAPGQSWPEVSQTQWITGSPVLWGNISWDQGFKEQSLL